MALPLALALAVPAAYAAERPRNAAAQQLAAATRGQAQIAYHGATGVARFVRLPGAKPGTLAPLAARKGSPQDQSQAFFAQYAGLFGMRSPATELRLVGSKPDAQGGSHLTYLQTYAGIPVFAGMLRTHFDKSGQLRSVNGTFVPNIGVPRQAARTPAQAAAAALRQVNAQKQPATILAAMSNRLLVYRENLARGIPGPSHLAYEVMVGDGAGVREFVYVDAMTGKPFDQITGIQDVVPAVNRRSYDGKYCPYTYPGPAAPGCTQFGVPLEYSASPIWVEGNTFPTDFACTQTAGYPTCNGEADNMLYASSETWSLFYTGFGRDSYDDAGALYDSIFDRGYSCPNASWNGSFISFCPGTTTDDITGHELGHAYTDYTHDLIYAWQPGALNESYSDIWGETLDLLNGRQTDSPNTARTDETCSAYSYARFPIQFTVNTPPSIAGNKSAGWAYFGAAFDTTGVTADLSLTTPTNGCAAITEDLTGKIALIDRGVCAFAIKAKNAQLKGASAVVIVNTSSAAIVMSGFDSTITVPVTSIGSTNGTAIKAEMALGPVNVTIKRQAVTGADDSYRWLMGEDSLAFAGAIRDMWEPRCYSSPAYVTDPYYYCSTGDQGGVHYNSGVPNHAFAMIVDGGTFNGQTITGIGLHKAGQIYYRAQTLYQVPDTDFADHADAIEQSCSDLVGQALPELSTGAPTGSTVSITSGDCAEVAKAMLAVEMRTPPSQCNFQPMLAKNPPAVCPAGTSAVNVFTEGFESGGTGWTVSHVAPEITTDWALASVLPGGRSGSGFFAADPNTGTCAAGGDNTTVMYLTSPTFTTPSAGGDAFLTFDHYVATEAEWDGGNLKVQVNGGGFQNTADVDFTYNAYNMTLKTTGQGNTNPLQGQRAFTGSDGGSVRGSWGQSQFDLSNYAAGGDSVQLQFAFGTDGCGGRDGWYVDDVKVFTCQPGASVSDVSVAEGNSGTVNAAFVVSLAAASTGSVTVNYATADGTATDGTDYFGRTGSVIFPAGVTTRTVNVAVAGDTTYESDETFYLNLTSASGASISDAQGMATITNDDTTPSLTIGDVTVTEGNSGTTNAVFTVTQSAVSDLATTVQYATANGTATAGSDYAAASGTLTIAAGATSASLTVTVNGDTAVEGDETYSVGLSGAVNASIGDAQGVGTITNDDAGLATLAINSVSGSEGNYGATPFAFTVSLSAPSATAVTVKYTTANGSARVPGDYLGATGTLTFAPGETSKTVNVMVIGDRIRESAEVFYVNLSAPSGAMITVATGRGVILNDD